MSDYFGKIIELVDIIEKEEQLFLHIRFFNQDIERYWEIDRNTAESISSLIELGGNHKYRLSFQTAFDIVNNQYVSFLTRTYRDQSQRENFNCSVDFKKQLESLKNIRDVGEMDQLPFILKELLNDKVPCGKEEVVVGQKQTVENMYAAPKSRNTPFKWTTVALISLLFIGTISFFTFTSLDERDNNINTANAKMEVEPLEVEKADDSVPVPSPVIVEQASIPPSISEVVLDNSMTYSLPEGYVALTFDDGPSKYSVPIVDILKKYSAGATFFHIGYNVKKYPEIVEYIHQNGYAIGSHSMNHQKMSHISYEQQVAELKESIQAIEEVIMEKVNLFRPPYGAINEETKQIIPNYQAKMILWNRDPKDWNTEDPEKIFQYISSIDTSGSIILLHESQATVDALPRMIEYLQGQNLQIVNLK